MRGSRLSRALWSALIASAALLAQGSLAVAAEPRDLLPDLRMKAPTEWHITHQTTSEGPNRRLLRFTARMVNIGDGPLHIHGSRDCSTSACPYMQLSQRIYRSDGSHRPNPIDGKAKFNVGDGHNHWHVMNVERYMLVPLDGSPAAALNGVRAAKTGFCFFDTNASNLSLPRAPHAPVYWKDGCATGRPEALRIDMGLSVGWLDLYPWDIAAQWIDTTGLPDGRYLVCESADPNHRLLETHDGNNDAWSRIRLWHDSAGDHLRVIKSGRTPCSTQLPGAPAALWELDPPVAEDVRFAEGLDALRCEIQGRRTG